MEVSELLEKLGASFSKSNVHAALKAVKSGDLELDKLIEACEPQRAGGSSNNPSKEIDGVMHHWCRLTQGYLPEDEIQMTGGKPKGVGKLQASIAYRMEKRAKELRDEALAFFVSGKYAEGGEKNAEASKVEAMVDEPANFTKEAMAISEFNPNKDKSAATVVEADEEIL